MGNRYIRCGLGTYSTLHGYAFCCNGDGGDGGSGRVLNLG